MSLNESGYFGCKVRLFSYSIIASTLRIYYIVRMKKIGIGSFTF